MMVGRRTVRTAAMMGVVLAAAGLSLAGCGSLGGSAPAPGRAAVSGRCADESFPIYFARGSAELTEPARTVIASASSRIAGCRITAVDVRGISLPDEAGARADAAITQSRADNVARALAAAGLPAPAFDVQIAGSSRPPMRPNRREPLARRTEVVLHATPA